MKVFEYCARPLALSDRSTRLALVAIIALIYYAAARLGLLLAFESTNASPVWPPTGIAFAALLLFGNRIWPAIAFSAFAANYAVFSQHHIAASAATAFASLSIATGNTLEALLGAYLVRRFIGVDDVFEHPTNVFKLLMIVVLMCMVSAAIGTQSLMIFQLAPVAARSTILLNWWLGDVGGALLIMPTILCWLGKSPASTPVYKRGEIALALLGLGIIAALVFSGKFLSLTAARLALPLCFFCIAWAVYRYGRRGATLASCLLTASALFGTLHGVGPFTAGPLNDSLILLVCFVVLLSITGLVLVADLSERARTQHKAIHCRELISSWLPLLGALVLTIVAWHVMSADTERQASERLNQLAIEAQRRILNRMESFEEILQGAQGLFAASPTVAPNQWKAYIAALTIDERFPDIVALGYAAKVNSSSAAISSSAQARTDALTVPVEAPAFSFIYVEPFHGGDTHPVGFDMFSEPKSRAAMSLARDSGRAVLTDQVALMQRAGAETPTGLLMYLPVFKNGAPHATVAERHSALIGFVYGAFRVRDLIEGALGKDAALLELELYDGAIKGSTALMYSTAALANTNNQFAPARFEATLPTVATNHAWTLRVTARPAFEQTVDRQKAQLVLIAGAVISLLLFTLARSQALTTTRALHIADRSRDELRASEDQLQILMDSLTDYAIFMLDPDGRIMTWNNGAQLITGYRASEIIGQHFSRFYLQSDIDRKHPQAELKIAAIVGRYSEEGWRVRQDGSTFWAGVVITTVRDHQNSLLGFSKVTRDLTDRKAAEQALTAMNQRLSLAMNAAGIGFWEWDIRSGILLWDDQSYNMYGVEKGTASNAYTMWCDAVMSEDIERMECEFNESLTSARPFASEFRITRGDGQRRTLKTGGIAIKKDEQGQPVHIVGVNWDVTDMRNTESALRASEERFRSAMENAPIGMAVISLDGIWLEVNRAICDIVGYEKAELIQLTFQDITHPDDLEADLANLHELLAGKVVSYHMEKRYYRRDRSIVWVNLTVSLVRDAAGAPLYFISQIEDITARRDAEQQLSQLAHFDTLTGLANRVRLRYDIDQMLLRAQRRGDPLAVVFIDLDNFKEVNDTQGHEAGDFLLKTVAVRLQQTVRATDRVARLGGDEFVLLLPEVKSVEDVGTVLEKVRLALLEPIDINGHEAQVGASFGVSMYPDDGSDVTELFRCADSALYHAKAEGRNNVQFYRRELTTRIEQRLSIGNFLRYALERDELVLHYQPIVALAPLKMVGAEALIRWRHPQHGLVLPQTFIPIAEATGLIIPIGEWVIAMACREAAGWLHSGNPLRISVNVSVKQFASGDLVGVVKRALQAENLPGKLLCLEITEQIVMQDIERNRVIIAELKALGVCIAIDDFGVGYSSLSYLRRFAPDILKIDRSFIDEVAQDGDDRVIVKAVIAMARSLNMQVVAEGVETTAQNDFLTEQHCDFSQGYLFSEPVTAEAFKVFALAH